LRFAGVSPAVSSDSSSEGENVKRSLIAVAILLFTFNASAQQRPESSPKAGGPQVEAQVRKLWDAFQKKDKATLSTLIDDGFRQFEEGLTTFGDKKTEVNAVDEYDLLKFTLTDFKVKPLAANMALVTYIADYEGKTGGEVAKAKSVFGEVWTRASGEWKCLYMQETYLK
jgi:hypothetical protein